MFHQKIEFSKLSILENFTRSLTEQAYHMTSLCEVKPLSVVGVPCVLTGRKTVTRSTCLRFVLALPEYGRNFVRIIGFLKASGALKSSVHAFCEIAEPFQTSVWRRAIHFGLFFYEEPKKSAQPHAHFTSSLPPSVYIETSKMPKSGKGRAKKHARSADSGGSGAGGGSSSEDNRSGEFITVNLAN